MSRRRKIAIISAAFLLGLLVIAVFMVVMGTRTGYGRAAIRNYIASKIDGAALGKWHIGKISGGLFAAMQIDSLEIRDANDSLFLASGPVSFDYDLRDLIDRRVLLRRVEIQRLVLNLTQYSRTEWNFDRLFRKRERLGPVPLERRYDDFIRAENVVVHGGTVVLSQPWRPDTQLVGTRRDSSITWNLARKDAEIVRAGNNFARIRRFDNLNVETGLRWKHPDTAGRFFDVAKLALISSDPPLDVRSARGTVLVVQDSVWINAHELSLPSSSGALAGKVVSGSDLPTRYRITIRGDTVALKDINWVYRPLPTEGGGKVVVHIRNDPANVRIMEYALSDLDLRTTHSRLTGTMTFGVGAPKLRITEVNLNAAPLDFRFIEHMGGAPMPVPWSGQFAGQVQARGGPVNEFVVDKMAFTFHDANVPLAITTGTATGMVDITRPAEAIFRGFDVNFGQLDLRTVEFLFAGLPRIGGVASGRAHLDSLWRDVRFSESDFQLRRGSLPPSHFTGSGRITQAVPFIVFDVNLVAQPISFNAFADAFPGLPVRGVMSGPIVIKGTLDQLAIRTDLKGPSGAVGFEGTIDNAAPGYSIRGRGTTDSLDLRSFLAGTEIPSTRLTAVLDGALTGDSVANLSGNLNVRTRQSSVERLRVASTDLALRFGGGRVHLDTLSLRSPVGSFGLTGGGALGLSSRATDSVRFSLTLDEPGVLPGFVAAMLLRARPDSPGLDSLKGRVNVDGFVSGSLKDLDVGATVVARSVSFQGHRIGSATGSVHLASFMSPRRNGSLSLQLDSASVAGIPFKGAAAQVTLDKSGGSTFRVEGSTVDGAYALVKGKSQRADGYERIDLDTLRLDLSSNVWDLSSPGRITRIGGGYSVENLELRAPNGARVSAAGIIPATGAMDLRVLAEKLPVPDIARMARIQTAFGGTARVELAVAGTRDSPLLTLNASVDSAGISDSFLDRITVFARYSDRRLATDVGLYHQGVRAVTIVAQVPLDLRFRLVEHRIPNEVISGRITANSVHLGVLEPFFPQLRQARGRFTANLDVSGSWRQPRLLGRMTVGEGGAFLSGLGLQLRNLNADIAFTGDSAVFRRFSTAYEGGAPADTASLSGYIAFTDYANPDLNLDFFANGFRIVQLPRVAELYINSRLRLAGKYNGSALSGYVSLDKGAFFIPELSQKRLLDLRDIDSSLFANREFTPPVPSEVLRNLELRSVRVTVGDQVWLRSVENNASIQLGGSVSMTSVRVPKSATGTRSAAVPGARIDSVYRLALEGTLSADRGDYRLDVGVVQRKFQVEPGGTVTFFGEPELNPTLNISAVHSVRRVSGQDAGRDIRIRVRLVGSLSDYQVRFESVDGLELSQSDMISYLVTGSPSFELGSAGNANLRTAYAILVPSLGVLLGDQIAGSRFDHFQLDLAPLGETDRLGESLREAFKRARVGVGKQIGPRTFVSASTNLCQIGGLLEGQSASTEELVQSVGVKVEQRLNNNYSMAFSAEPSTAAVRCAAAGSSARGLISSPPQFGFDLFKVWRF